jgi:hypothetical protein
VLFRSVDVDLGSNNISPILKALMDRGVTIKSFDEEAPNLETTFLALTGSELSAGDTEARATGATDAADAAKSGKTRGRANS